MGNRHSLGPVAQSVSPSARSQSVQWVPPAGSTLKLNVDAAFDVSSGKAAGGCLLRDASGQVLFAAAFPLPNCWLVDLAECWAVLEAEGGPTWFSSIHH